MIWAAKKGSKGESLQNILQILLDFCLLLLKQLIPARGRKQNANICRIVRARKQLIPARGRKPFHPYHPKSRFRKQLIPARGRKPRTIHQLQIVNGETTHPREGTETRISQKISFFSSKQLIPARGRKPIWVSLFFKDCAKQLIPARGRKHEYALRLQHFLRNNSSPRGDGNFLP